jgi:hypothetical protein
MRELIYLSERKLREFQEVKRRSRPWARVRQLGVTAPLNLGGMQVMLSEQAASKHPHLAQVLHHLDRSGPLAWFSEEGQKAGSWVRFDTLLNYKLLDGKPNSGQPALLFWTPGPEDLADWPTRLLLHGSPEHLVGGLASQRLPVESVALRRSAASGLIDLLNGGDSDEWSLASTLARLLYDLDRKYPAETACRMSGYARLTASVQVPTSGPRIVVASPLFIEYTSR